MIGEDSDGDIINLKIDEGYMPILRRYKLNSLEELHKALFDADESTIYHKINGEKSSSLSPEVKNFST
jgi:hypothetical protein